MGFSKNDDRRASFLISVLVRYPEVATVNYDPRQQTIRIGLLVSGGLVEEEFDRTKRVLTDTIDVYNLLEQRKPVVVEVGRETHGDLTAVSIRRDVATLTAEEIYTILEFVRERFSGRLVSEYIDFTGEDDMIAQDEMIQEVLADLQSGRRNGRNLIAIREDGRVMVFQK